MSLNQLIQFNNNVPCLPWKKIKVYDLNACHSVDSPEGSFTNVDTVTINGAPYPPGGGAIPALIPNKFLRTSGVPSMFWGDVDVPSIIHGTAKQILHTNSAGTAAEWTTNLEIPGNATVDLNLTVTGSSNLGSNVECHNDLAVDGNFSVLGSSSVESLDTNGPLDVKQNMLFNGSSGVFGQFVKKTGLGTQAFANITAADIGHGTAAQILHTNLAGTASEWTTDLSIPGNAGVSLTLSVGGNAGFAADVNVSGDLRFVGVSGNPGDVLTKTGAATQSFQPLAVAPSSLTPGTNGDLLKTVGGVATWAAPDISNINGTGILGQVIQSDGAGHAVYNTDVTMPGNLAMPLGSLFACDNLTMYSQLKLAGNAGTDGQVCLSDGSSIAYWGNPQYTAQYYQNVPLVDMNSAPVVLLLANALVNIPNSNISYAAGVFTVAEAGTYQLTFETRPDTCAAQTEVNFAINGVLNGSVVNSYIPALAVSSQLYLIKTYRLNASDTISVISHPLVAGAINTSGSDTNGAATTMITITRLGAYI